MTTLLLAQGPSASKWTPNWKLLTPDSRLCFLFHKRLHRLESCHSLISQTLAVPGFPRLPVWTYVIQYIENNLLDWLPDCENKTLSDILGIGECWKSFHKFHCKKCTLCSPCTNIFIKWFCGVYFWAETWRIWILLYSCDNNTSHMYSIHSVSKIKYLEIRWYTEFLTTVLSVKTTTCVFFLNI